MGMPERQPAASYEDHVAAGHVPYRPDCEICQAAGLRRRMHRRFGNLATEGTLAVDLSGPHIATPLPDSAVAPEYVAHYFLAAYFYPGTDIDRDPSGASEGVDTSVFDGKM